MKCYLCGNKDSTKWYRIKIPNERRNFYPANILPVIDISNYSIMCDKCMIFAIFDSSESGEKVEEIFNDKVRNKNG